MTQRQKQLLLFAISLILPFIIADSLMWRSIISASLVISLTVLFAYIEYRLERKTRHCNKTTILDSYVVKVGEYYSVIFLIERVVTFKPWYLRFLTHKYKSVMSIPIDVMPQYVKSVNKVNLKVKAINNTVNDCGTALMESRASIFGQLLNNELYTELSFTIFNMPIEYWYISAQAELYQMLCFFNKQHSKPTNSRLEVTFNQYQEDSFDNDGFGGNAIDIMHKLWTAVGDMRNKVIETGTIVTDDDRCAFQHKMSDMLLYITALHNRFNISLQETAMIQTLNNNVKEE